MMPSRANGRWCQVLAVALIVQLWTVASTTSSSAASSPLMHAAHAAVDHSSHTMPMGGHDTGGPDCQFWCALQAGVSGSSMAPPQSAILRAPEFIGLDRPGFDARQPRHRLIALDPPPPRY